MTAVVDAELAGPRPLQELPTEKTAEGWRNLIVQQVLEGLQRLQDAYVMHRDLKAANMMMAPCSSSPGMLQVKLADFGTAILVQKPDDGKDPEQHLCLQATRIYTTYTVAPPEVLQLRLYTFGTDSWAVGVLYLELCIGKQWLKLPEQERERERERCQIENTRSRYL